MAKIICEYCGTSYKSTLKECPICGNATPEQPQEEPEEQVPVKKSRREEAPAEPQTNLEREELYYRRAQAKKRAKVTCSVLGVLVVLLGLYIGYRFWKPYHTAKPVQTPTSGVVSCTSLSLGQNEVVFTQAGQTSPVSVEAQPVDTTDPIRFAVANPDVATVSDTGVVTAVGEGTTVVTVTCGAFRRDLTVTCDFGGGVTEPTAPATEAPTEPVAYALSSEDFTLFYAGDAATLRVSGVTEETVEWSSEDPAVATVDNGGRVVAVGGGTTTIHAKVGDQDLTCIVRCSFESGSTGSGKLSHTDVTIAVDEKFTISLTVNGVKVDASWSSEDEEICTVDATGVVTGVSSGKTYITGEYDGATYTCVVYVK